MPESFPKNEFIEGIVDEQVIDALRAERSDAQALFEIWYKVMQKTLDDIYETSGSESFTVACIESAIRRAVVYYKAGHIGEAVADLAETADAAGAKLFEDSGLYEQATDLLRKMRGGETL